MNVKDVTEISVAEPGTRLKAIFTRQRELMEKYEKIEASNGLLQTPDIPVDLNDAKGQARLKDFAWRITEELAEAKDAYEQMMLGPAEDMEGNMNEVFIHIHEELMDSLHFLVEMTILSDITADRLLELLPGEDEELEELDANSDILEVIFKYASIPFDPEYAFTNQMASFIKELGMLCHLLKNKPWKQSQMLTDIAEYNRRMVEVFAEFLALCFFCGMNPKSIYELYFSKSEVNKFRQRSNY